MEKIINIIKKQAVLTIALTAALISVFIIPPDAEYSEYLNVSVLIQLFCLMITVSGFRSTGLFEKITHFLADKSATARKTSFLLMNLCFFFSMLVTNDVALLTFVPLTIMVFADEKNPVTMIKAIVIETAAANLGSMMTPVGNPQNLYIYAEYNMSAGEFIKTMLPVGILSYIILALLNFLIPDTPVALSEKNKSEKILSEKHNAEMISYSVMFILCLMAVFRIIPNYVCLAVSVIIPLIFRRELFKRVDYALLATFVCFFVFVGNIARIETVRNFFSMVINGRELIVSALLSQVISNVPAAVMLSGFTDNACQLLAGVNIGGLGTPVASLASLISYQLYSKSENSQSGKYLGFFSAVNFSMLALLLAFKILIG